MNGAIYYRLKEISVREKSPFLILDIYRARVTSGSYRHGSISPWRKTKWLRIFQLRFSGVSKLSTYLHVYIPLPSDPPPHGPNPSNKGLVSRQFRETCKPATSSPFIIRTVILTQRWRMSPDGMRQRTTKFWWERGTMTESAPHGARTMSILVTDGSPEPSTEPGTWKDGAILIPNTSQPCQHCLAMLTMTLWGSCSHFLRFRSEKNGGAGCNEWPRGPQTVNGRTRTKARLLGAQICS